MAKNVTKTEYYQSKNIPLVTFCRKLEPEPPVRNHLLESLPRLGTELQKILSHQKQQNRANLELANALKIIHELEDQLQLISSESISIEEKYFQSQTENSELERNIKKLNGRISDLEATIQKKQFQHKNFYEKQIEKHNAIVFEYERKYQNLLEENKKIRLASQVERKQAKSYHDAQINRADSQNKEFESISQANLKHFQAQLTKLSQQNTILRNKIFELQTQNQSQISDLQKKNTSQIMTIKELKTNYEHKILSLSTDIDLSQNKLNQNKQKCELLQNRVKKQKQMWEKERQKWILTQEDAEKDWKIKYESISVAKDKINQQLQQKMLEINAKIKQNDQLSYELEKHAKYAQNFTQQYEVLEKKYKIDIERIQKDLQTEYNNKMNEARMNCERQFNLKMTEKCQQLRQQITSQFSKEHAKLIQTIKSLQIDRSQAQHKCRLAEQAQRKLNHQLQTLKIDAQYHQKHISEQKQSFNIQLQTMKAQYEQRINSLENLNKNNSSKLKNETDLALASLKQYHEKSILQLNSTINKLQNDKKKLQEQIAQNRAKHDDENICFIEQIKTLDVQIMQMVNKNENLDKKLKEMQRKLIEKNGQLENNGFSLVEENKKCQKLNRELKDALNTISQLKKSHQVLESDKQVIISQNSKTFMKLQTNYKSVQRQLQLEFKKKNQLEQTINKLQSQISRLQQQKINLRKNITQSSQNAKAQWQKIQNDFSQMNKKILIESQGRQKQLNKMIDRKTQENKKNEDEIMKLTNLLNEQKRKSSMSMAELKTRIREIQQANKTLGKEKGILQNYEKQIANKDRQIQMLNKQIKQFDYDICNKIKVITDLQKKVDQLKFESDRYATERSRNEAALKNHDSKIKLIENDRDNLNEKIKGLQKQIVQINEEKCIEVRKMRQEIHKINMQLDEQLKKNADLLNGQQRKSMEKQKIWQKKISDQSIRNKVQKEELVNRITQLQHILYETQQKLRYEQESFNKNKMERDREIEKTNKMHTELIYKVEEYEHKLLQVSQQIKETRAKYQIEKKANGQLRMLAETFNNQKPRLIKQLNEAMSQIKRLNKLNEKNEQDIGRIYQQNDRRVQQVRNETKRMYQKELSINKEKVRELMQNMHRINEQSQWQIKKIHQKYSKTTETQQKQIIEKKEKITELTIDLQKLEQLYNSCYDELQRHKMKWAEMFNCVDKTNSELNNKRSRFTREDFKTQQKRIIRTETETKSTVINENKTEKIISGENYRMSTGLMKSKDMNTHQDWQGSAKKIKSLLRDSDSDVINSRVIGGNTDSHSSIQYECSSEAKSSFLSKNINQQ